ncbi:MAG: bis(5'-nucleosyl)-tetraphosphatase (symmetrical) YqeK [Firmicutes bacterium]|nr:bis(5'-nucleosyl)-tetraphosphatase (symmetrical) YqeK [Bacillota bacterium]
MDSIEKIKAHIEKNFSEKRKAHTYGVVDTAIKLAEKYGCDVYKAELAALFHDLYRSMPINVLNYHVKHLELDKKYMDNSNLSHGKIAAIMIQRDFGISDEDIINAVSYHTTGRPNMSLLEKIIYIADAVEPNRNYPGVDELRRVVKEDLDKAIYMSLSRTIDYVSSEGNYLDEDTIHAKKYFEELINKGE